MSEPAPGEKSMAALRGQIQHAIPLALFDYWNLARRGRAMPSRSDVDPLAIPRSALPFTMLIDVLWQAHDAPVNPRLRYRLMGTGVIVSREGLVPLDPTGWYLDQIPHRQGDIVSRMYRGVAASAEPAYHTGAYAPDHPRLAGTYHRLAMPLSDDGAHVNMLLAAFCRGADKG